MLSNMTLPSWFTKALYCGGSVIKGAFDWEIRISQFHLREIRPQGGFQLRNPNPDFLDFPFCRSSEKSEKGFAKLIS